MRKNATHQGLQARNDPYLLYRGAGAKGCCPFPLHRKSPPTWPSGSLRNTVRLPSGNNFHLYRNPPTPSVYVSSSRRTKDTAPFSGPTTKTIPGAILSVLSNYFMPANGI
jgi:hypothetical protein